ncbi:glycosyl hydrolase 115 family protein [Pelagicoccus sp. SDUM812002]|uniref:glycosyl hydrolase 115 family protein n=1 Tax=Pelagicoccus sp. SDUM812002 TaxID=3041266 RepID=UPI00280C8A6E|nr:glycosyl hydrolase 115 family protein [Pelagicoccus sp. SDUM812002]MDQ8186140.1 glycosyl hydrolase 115 family protein [Pelagicoccus sp. SDUM812002]
MLRYFSFFCALSAIVTGQAAPDWISATQRENAFPIASRGKVASIHFASEDATVVSIAATHLAQDIEAVTGRKTELNPQKKGPKIFIGTLGQSSLIESLDLAGHIDLEQLEGRWESFLIATFPDPNSRGTTALAIVGSDRRGTAYGVYELSQAIGVSPWNWWADVPAKKSSNLWVKSGTQRFGPPSVKYRGIFINDEDWGLHPWAAHTFDPQLGDIGPKTYEKVFELLLRLKANTLWPAMHEVTKAFNSYPENKRIADDFAIVMGSSHAEPLLRNNVTEWSEPKSHFNFSTHSKEVTAYWETRVEQNAPYENIYTLGMRGIHDSGMTGASTMQDKVDALSKIFKTQRELLANHVSPDIEAVPQAFTPYKEVLEIYRAGLEVPEEVALVWPDDNHGYIRYLPNEAERKRRGGSGVYYHLSYLGSPLAYLWLCTTPPPLIWTEMNKAYQLGARNIWIANVGDIKPAEKETELFLQMAWDIDRWSLDTLPDFLETWAAREFGSQHATAIAEILDAYYQLNYQRRPEHLQWWLPHTRVRSSTLNGAETKARVQAFSELVRSTDAIGKALPSDAQDAFFQLVAYPVKASAYANLRYFHAEQHSRNFNQNPLAAREHAARSREADAQVIALTRHYNQELAGGKWRRMMSEEPADAMWRSYRASPIPLPSEAMARSKKETIIPTSDLSFLPNPSQETFIAIEAEAVSGKRDLDSVRWDTVPGLGRIGDSVLAGPPDAATIPLGEPSPYLEYEFEIHESGDYNLQAELIPSFPLNGQSELRFAFSIDDGDPQLMSVARTVNDNAWKQAVLTAQVTVNASGTLRLDDGKHLLRLYFVDPGVSIDRIFLTRGEPSNSFFGPRD